MEGVMMRGRQRMVVAVRNPSGEIVIHEEPLTARIYTSSWGQWPFVRGLSLLWDTLGLGMRALMWSADVAMSEEEQKIEFSGPVAWTTVAFSLLVSIGLFFLLPTSIAHFLERWFPGQLASAAIEGVVRLGLFVAYLWVIGLMPDIRRVFMYHGVRSMARTDAIGGCGIARIEQFSREAAADFPPGVAVDDGAGVARRGLHQRAGFGKLLLADVVLDLREDEAGVPLVPAEVRKFTVQHPRCGTSFLFIVVALSIVLFAPFHFDQWYLRLASRLLLIPVLAGIAYEFIRYSASHLDNRLVRALTRFSVQPVLKP